MVNHFVVTLTGSAQKLGAGLSGACAHDPLKFLSIQAFANNTHVVYVGGNQTTVSSSSYGFRIEVPVTSIPYAPTVIELPAAAVSLDDIWVIGTADEKISIFAAM